MSAALARLLSRRPRVILAIYWLFSAIVTHVPPIFAKSDGPRDEPLIGLDKIAHFIGYAGLAFVLMNALTQRRSHNAEAGASDFEANAAASQARVRGFRLGLMVTLFLCAAYGVVDELTQPPFGRTADPADWVADLIGAAVGIAAFLWWARRASTSH